MNRIDERTVEFTKQEVTVREDFIDWQAEFDGPPVLTIGQWRMQAALFFARLPHRIRHTLTPSFVEYVTDDQLTWDTRTNTAQPKR